MAQYFIKRNNQVNGPFTPDQIKVGIKSKKLKPTDKVATSKDGPWEPLFGQENKAAQAPTTAQPPPLPATHPLGQNRPKTKGRFPPPVGAGISEKTSPKTTKGSHQTLVIGATVAVLGFVTVAIYFGGTYLWQGASATWHEQQAQQEQARERRRQQQASSGSGFSSNTPGKVIKNVGRKLGLNQAEREQLKRDINRIESSLSSSEILSSTVFQQQVGRVDACLEMTGVVAKAFGVQSSDISSVRSQMKITEISTNTVFQQLAVHLKGHMQMLALACKAAGASPSSINTITQSTELNDTMAKTAQQQIAARTSGVMKMAELLAQQLGSDSSNLSSIRSSVSANDSLSNTVFQQMSARQTGVVKMLGAAAVAAGADGTTVSRIQSSLSTDDVLVDTAQQQYAARIKRTFEMTTELARAIVMK